MDKKLVDKISKRKSEGTLRSLSYFKGDIDFYSNDYLGLSYFSSTEIQNTKHGSTGSRLISGNSTEAIKCEQVLADFFRTESALVFNSGYTANLGLFSAVPQRGDTILYDEKIHASVRDGIRLSLANSYSFKHNSQSDLRVKLKAAKGTKYIAVESLYSMDGDIAPLKDLLEISKEYKAYLIVDEAHTCGVFGDKGRGIVDGLNLANEVFARVITFGKAYGAHGACVLGDENLIEYLINFARPFIYTTALPPKEYTRIEQIVHSEEIPIRQKKLHQNIAYFRSVLKSDLLISEINSPIQIIRIGNIEKLSELSILFEKESISIKPIYSPTVKIGQECLRICIHSFNTKNEIDRLCIILKKALY